MCRITINLKKIYYINLDRKPDRKAHMEHLFAHDDRLERVRAVDGRHERAFIMENREWFRNRELDLAMDYEANPDPNKPKPDHHYYDTDTHFAIMGNALSHRKVWRKVASELENPKDCALVMQDDAIVSHLFLRDIDSILQDIPEDAKVVWLSRHKEAVGSHFRGVDFYSEPDIDGLFKRRVTNSVGELKPEENPCSLAYLVTKEGAQWLLDNSPTNSGAMDSHMNNLLHAHSIQYATYRPYMTSDNRIFFSSIFDPID